jgi:hypothetical protein
MSVPDGSQVVRDVLAELGQLPPTEESKALLTRMSCWRLHQSEPSWGLVRKTSGNQVRGLSTDLIMWRPTGEIVDVTTDDGGRIQAMWGVRAPQDALPPDRWVAPTPEGPQAVAAPPETPAAPPTIIQQTVDLTPVLARLDEQAALLRELKQEIVQIRQLAADRPAPPAPPAYEGNLMGVKVVLHPRPAT